MPTTTRATPAAMIASVQGPVRPVWLHGSSVTYSVAPRAASPAAASATISAWARPGSWVAPSNMLAVGVRTTAPTHGLGDVMHRTRPPRRWRGSCTHGRSASVAAELVMGVVSLGPRAPGPVES